MTRLTPFTIQVLSNRIGSILNEQQTALIRTAFSTVVRESEDLACGVFNQAGLMIAQSLTGTPGHVNSMATGVKHFVDAFPPATLEPGDVLITNDPWMTAGQVNDFTVVTPVFRDGRPIAYFASTCHAPDIGGRQFSGEAREVYEEGLQIPMLKILRAGEPNRDVLEIIRTNVRQPDETIGDIYAQISSNEVGAERLRSLLDEFDLPDVEEIADEIISRSERAMRAGIAALPDGTYTNEAWSDGYDEPIVLRCTDHGRGRRAARRLDGQLAAELARDQSRAQLHARVRLVRDEGRGRARGAAQRRRVPTRARLGAARVDPQLRASRTGRVAPRDRPLPAGHHLRRARAGDGGPSARRLRRRALDHRLAGAGIARAGRSCRRCSSSAGWVPAPRRTASAPPGSRPASRECPPRSSSR